MAPNCHPSGKILYVSNQGHDSIATFQIDRESGRLTLSGFTATGGKWPVDFCCDPTGKWMLVGNQDSDSVFVFSIDPETGELETTGIPVPVPSPTCITFAPGGR